MCVQYCDSATESLISKCTVEAACKSAEGIANNDSADLSFATKVL